MNYRIRYGIACLTLLTSLSVYSHGSGGKPIASARADAPESMRNMLVYQSKEAKPSYLRSQGTQGWKLDAIQPETEALHGDLNDNVLYALSPEQTVCLTVRYLDKGYGGFALCYDAQGNQKKGKFVQLHNTGEWIDHTFELYDARLANGLDGVDFVITTHDKDVMGKAPDPVGIASIEVELTDQLSPYQLHVESGKTGNIFFEHEPIRFYIQCLDITGQHPCRELTYTVLNEWGKTIHRQSCIPTDEEARIELPALPYGVYELVLEMKGKNSYQKIVTDFARSRRADEVNRRFGTNVHFDWVVYNDHEIKQLATLVKNVGYSLVRTSLRWYQMEKVKGQFALTHNILYSNQCLKDLGLKMVGILSQENPLYDADPYWLESEEKREAYARFCAYMVNMLKEYTNLFTYPNEFNLTRGGKHNETNYRQNMDIVKAAYPAIKQANPNAFILSSSVSRYDDYYLRGLFSLGLAQYCDAVSVHLYDFIGGPEAYYAGWPWLNVYPNTRLFHELMRKLAPNKKAWITENGWPTYPGDLTAEEAHQAHFMCVPHEQARWYARSFILNSDTSLIDKFIHYDFVDNEVGYFNRESNFGIIHSHNHRTPFSAKPAFITVAAFNDIVGNATFVENTADQYLPEDKRDRFACRFVNDLGEEIVCFWQQDDRLLSDLSVHTYTYTSDMPYLEIYDMYGNREVVKNKTGSYTAAYTDRPVYIKGVKEVKPW